MTRRPLRLLPLLLWACSVPESEPFKNDGPGDLIDNGEDSGGAADGGDTGGPIEPLACNPLNIAGDCLLPWPSSEQMVADSTSETGLRLHISADGFVSPDGPLPVDPARWAYADGASPTTPILVNFGVDVDPTQLLPLGAAELPMADDAPIALVRLSTGERVRVLTEMDQNQRHLDYEARWALIIRPLEPLAFGERYAVVITTDLRAADGAALPTAAPFIAWRDGTATGDPALEARRPAAEALFTALEGHGFAREDLQLAWEFNVKSELAGVGLLRDMRNQAAAIAAAEGFTYTIDEVIADPSPDVAAVVRGTFVPPSFLTEDNVMVLDGYRAVRQTPAAAYPFRMVIPAVARERRGLPLALIGHGIFGTGESMLEGGIGRDVTWPIAQELGAVLVATDWIGLSGGDLDLIVREVVPDLSRINLVTDRLAQSQVNALTLAALAAGPLSDDPALDAVLGIDRSAGAPLPLLLPDDLTYYGVSLGGVQGSTFLSLCPEVQRAVVAVPGAGWGHMIQRSTHFSAIETVIDALYPDPLSQLLFISLMQHDFDRSDPATMGALLGADPDFPERALPTVILQEGIGDVQVPNLATNILARRLGAAHLEVAGTRIEGLPTVPSPATGVVLTAITLPELLADYTPPDENTIPVRDNGVHGEVPLAAQQLNQLRALIRDGQAVHLCDGPCDPN